MPDLSLIALCRYAGAMAYGGVCAASIAGHPGACGGPIGGSLRGPQQGQLHRLDGSHLQPRLFAPSSVLQFPRHLHGNRRCGGRGGMSPISMRWPRRPGRGTLPLPKCHLTGRARPDFIAQARQTRDQSVLAPGPAAPPPPPRRPARPACRAPRAGARPPRDPRPRRAAGAGAPRCGSGGRRRLPPGTRAASRPARPCQRRAATQCGPPPAACTRAASCPARQAGPPELRAQTSRSPRLPGRPEYRRPAQSPCTGQRPRPAMPTPGAARRAILPARPAAAGGPGYMPGRSGM